ncbi:hypothetical protein QE152_g17042 [Popillia japonica]|uniref:Uncharacterized protein n=1 Tax=Popillia japonica TaxID=7064 RepID=A0AAW1L5E1_POPJA
MTSIDTITYYANIIQYFLLCTQNEDNKIVTPIVEIRDPGIRHPFFMMYIEDVKSDKPIVEIRDPGIRHPFFMMYIEDVKSDNFPAGYCINIRLRAIPIPETISLVANHSHLCEITCMLVKKGLTVSRD